MRYKKITIVIFLICIFTIFPSQSFAQVMMNGTIIGLGNSQVQVTSPLTVDSLALNSAGFTTRATSNDELRTYSFDRMNNATLYTVYWTGISPTEIDFSIPTLVNDARTNTTGSQLNIVTLNGQATGFSFLNNLNTIILKSITYVKEYFGPKSGGGFITTYNQPTSMIPIPVQTQTLVTDNTQLFIGIGVIIAVIVMMVILMKMSKGQHRKKSSIKDFNKKIRGT